LETANYVYFDLEEVVEDDFVLRAVEKVGVV
jgi:hypothetical protein